MSRYRGPLIPRLFSYWWDNLERPHRLLNQRVALRLHPDNFFGPSVFDDIRKWERLMVENWHRPWSEFLREHENAWSVVKDDKNKLHVVLNVQQYNPDEIKVKVIDDFIIVEGKHEEKEDDNGMVTKHFVRKYMVPEECDPEKVTSALSSDGVLTITASMRPEAIEEKKERIINIEHTGKPAEEDESKMKEKKTAQG